MISTAAHLQRRTRHLPNDYRRIRLDSHGRYLLPAIWRMAKASLRADRVVIPTSCRQVARSERATPVESTWPGPLPLCTRSILPVLCPRATIRRNWRNVTKADF